MRKLPNIIMPTPEYGKGGEYVRDRLVRQFGETSVMKAEIAICIQLMMMNGIIKGSQFVELLEQVLKKNEDRRRAQAGFKD
jgi:hypothetical protein